jgi:putative ABC transport system ATP-binding protein
MASGGDNAVTRTSALLEGAADGEQRPMTGNTVRLVDVTKIYQSSAGVRVPALDGVSLDIPAGQTLAVTGRSGSGKSTLLHLIGAMDIADRGEVEVDGQDLTTLSDRQRATYRRGIGFVFQRFHLLPALTACDNVVAPVLPFRTGFNKQERALGLLAAVGLEGREHDLPSKLSGGQQQRVAIARALIGEPRMLLADEPTGNLDSATGNGVLELLFDLHATRGLTLLIATHDPAVAARCQRVIELRDGSVISDEQAASAS